MGSAFTQFLPFLLIIAVFYFLLIRPQQAQRRKMQDLLANLKTGDKVITNGGMYGKIVGFRNSVVQLEVAPQLKIEVARSAITGLQDESNGSSGKEAAKAKT